MQRRCGTSFGLSARSRATASEGRLNAALAEGRPSAQQNRLKVVRRDVNDEAYGLFARAVWLAGTTQPPIEASFSGRAFERESEPSAQADVRRGDRAGAHHGLGPGEM